MESWHSTKLLKYSRIKIESYLLIVSIPNHIGIQAAYLYSDAMFVTLNRGPYDSLMISKYSTMDLGFDPKSITTFTNIQDIINEIPTAM